MMHRSDGELQAWLDAELERDAAAEVAEHLLVCVECRARLGSLRTAGEELKQALESLDGLRSAAAEQAPAVEPRAPESGTARRPGRAPRRGPLQVPFTLARAAALLLVVAGAAAAVVPGSPVRDWIARWTAPDVAPPDIAELRVLPADPDATARPVPARSPGVASVTVAPLKGRVTVDVVGFAEGTRVRVRTGGLPDVRARLVSGRAGARFSVGPGQLEIFGSRDDGPGEILLELPAGLRRATVRIDGAEALIAAPGADERPGEASIETPRDETVLRVGG